MFGGSHEHVDPKTGLALYGPYCPPGLGRPALSSIIVGAVGPAPMVADAGAWVDACRDIITNSGAEPFLYPHFPGCRQDQLPFYCDLLFRDQWCETIRDAELKRALAQPIFEDRLMALINLYMAGLETLKGREPQPNVVLLCLPQDVVDRCAIAAPGDQRVTVVKRRVTQATSSRQLELFTEPVTDDEGEFKRQNRGSLPTRLVVHKRSRFWEDELEGFQSGAKQVPLVDLVALGERGIRFFRLGDFPPLRGTYVKFSDQNFLLYTTGFVPFLRTYPGARIPQPAEVLEHYGDSPWDHVLAELLSLTKLNWNSADFAARYPITLAFSSRVGEILAEIPEDIPFRQEYRFYM